MGFPTHSELKEIWADQKRSGDAERMLADDGVTPEAGHFYTVSKDFTRGDGSWTEDFWEVLNVTGPKAFVRIHRDHGDPIERFWPIADRAWYNADPAWALRTPKPLTQ